VIWQQPETALRFLRNWPCFERIDPERPPPEPPPTHSTTRGAGLWRRKKMNINNQLRQPLIPAIQNIGIFTKNITFNSNQNHKFVVKSALSSKDKPRTSIVRYFSHHFRSEVRSAQRISIFDPDHNKITKDRSTTRFTSEKLASIHTLPDYTTLTDNRQAAGTTTILWFRLWANLLAKSAQGCCLQHIGQTNRLTQWRKVRGANLTIPQMTHTTPKATLKSKLRNPMFRWHAAPWGNTKEQNPKWQPNIGSPLTQWADAPNLYTPI